MEHPAIRRVVELSGGSIIDVVRRDSPTKSDTGDDPLAESIEPADDTVDTGDDPAISETEARDSGAN